MPPEQQLQRAQVPELVQEYSAAPPLKGVMEGLDPALMDSLYPPLFCPDLENFRTLGGEWATRAGQVVWKTVPGTGPGRLLDNLYQQDTGPQTTRLAARGTGSAAQFYEFKEESDTSFQTVGSATLGGTGQPYFQGVTIGDRYLFTDRAGALRQYTRAAAAAGAISVVTNGTAPTTACGVTSRWYDRLEPWTTTSLAAWTASDATKFTVTDTTAANPPPGGGHSVNALVKLGTSAGATLTPTVTGTAVPSHTIAFWLYQRIDAKTFTQLGIGIGAADEYSLPLQTTAVNNWYPFFFSIGDIGTLNFMRLTVLDASRAPNGELLSALYLPGRLEGSYRWIYTYYNATTKIETAPSPISGNGTATDFSAIGVTNDANSGRAFQKCAALKFTASGTPDKIRIYRSGGVPELTKDERGFDVWYRVAEIFDFTTTLNGNVAAASTSLVVTAATHLSVGDTLVIDPGTAGKEEYVKVTAVAGTTITVKGTDLDNKTQVSHLSGVTVQVAYLDNTANETIDVTQPVDIQRNDPPVGCLFIQRSPEGRLWAFGPGVSVAVSNRATPDHPTDYLTFPDGVDPLTRRSLTQGWRFKVGGDTTDETIVWGGFYQGLAHILTKRHMYVVEALSQTDWGPIAVQKLFEVGCIAGDSVVEVNETLMWVADGPRVMRWRGRGTAPEVVSYLRVNERLDNAPAASWNQWFAKKHAIEKGNYYCLYFVPAGQTTCTMRLDYLADRDQLGATEIGDSWEPIVYYDATGTPLSFTNGVVRDGGADDRSLYQLDSTGAVWETEVGSLDGAVPIKCRAKTKRYPLAIYSRFPSGALGDVAPGSSRHILLGQVTMLTQLFIRNEGVTDSLNVQVTTGGSEYGEVAHSYTIDLSGSGDQEDKVRLHRDLYGRWAQITFSGDFSNRPRLRECVFFGLPIRSGAIRT